MHQGLELSRVDRVSEAGWMGIGLLNGNMQIRRPYSAVRITPSRLFGHEVRICATQRLISELLGRTNGLLVGTNGRQTNSYLNYEALTTDRLPSSVFRLP